MKLAVSLSCVCVTSRGCDRECIRCWSLGCCRSTGLRIVVPRSARWRKQTESYYGCENGFDLTHPLKGSQGFLGTSLNPTRKTHCSNSWSFAAPPCHQAHALVLLPRTLGGPCLSLRGSPVESGAGCSLCNNRGVAVPFVSSRTRWLHVGIVCVELLGVGFSRASDGCVFVLQSGDTTAVSVAWPRAPVGA